MSGFLMANESSNSLTGETVMDTYCQFLKCFPAYGDAFGM